MPEKKIIAVAGATGAQGGGLVRAILSEPGSGFSVRALTRNASSDRAKELAKRGAEIVAADIDDVESVKRAFQGVYGAYCVTFFWEHFSPEKEIAEATNMAKAAKQAGVEHVIWSTLEDTRKWVPLSDGRMPTLMGMFQFNRDFHQDFCGARSLDLARSLNPSLQTFDQWLAANKHRIPLEERKAGA